MCLVLLLSVLLPVCLTVVLAQNVKVPTDVTHLSLHTDEEEWEDSIGYKPIRVTEVDARLVYYNKPTRHTIKLGSFGYDDRTRLPKDFLKNPQGCYQVDYCTKHLVLYGLNPTPCRK